MSLKLILILVMKISLLVMLLSTLVSLKFLLCLILGDFLSRILMPWSIDSYRHLTQLARRGGSPLNFEFVEHHKVCFFTGLIFLVCFEFSFSIIDQFVLNRQRHLRLLLLALRVYGIWMVSSFKHTNSQHRYLEALLAYLHLVPKSNRRPCKRVSWRNLTYAYIVQSFCNWVVRSKYGCTNKK